MDVLFNQATVGLAECNTDGIFLRVNDYFCKMVGLSRSELIGRHLSEVLLPEDLPRVRTLLSGRMPGDRYEIEKMHLRSDGEEIWTRVAASLVRDFQGRPQSALAVYVDITEDKKREAALRESEERFRLLANSVPGFVWAADPDGTTTFVNEPWSEYTRRPREEAMGKGWTAFIHPDDAERTAAAWSRVQSTGEPYQVEVRLRRHDGEYRWFAVQANPIRDRETGRIASWSGLALDIHEGKMNEAALRESEARFRLLTDSLPGFVWTADPSGEVTYANERWQEATGLAPSEVYGSGWSSALHPDDLADTLAIWEQVRLLGIPYKTEFRYRCADGSYRWFAVRARPNKDPDTGEVTAWFGISIDINEQKMAEMALKESEQRLRATYEHAAIGIAEVGADRRLLAVNERLYRLSGYTREEVIGRDYQDFLVEEDREKDIDLFHRMMAGEFDTYSIELRIKHKDGRVIWGDISASRVDDEHGQPLYSIRVVRDITASREAEEIRTLLMHELNHRVKNTLSTVQSIVSQGLRKSGAPPGAKEDIETRLFALSRAHDVLTRESWEGAWLAEVVAEAIGPYRREGSQRFRITGPDVRLNTSQALAISMAVHELSTNAAKYGSLTTDTGWVEIAWSVVHSPTSRRLHFRWKEGGGPPVRKPPRRGFGTRLIERGLASELAGEVKIDFALDGVECVADVPLM